VHKGRQIVLEGTKVRQPFLILNDRFPIDDALARRQHHELARQIVEALAPVFASADEGFRPGAMQVQLRPIAVELDLVHPATRPRRPVDQRGKGRDALHATLSSA
jgi:hypothetical protein